MSVLESYFSFFRKGIIGINQEFVNPVGEKKKIIYADWTASGRMYEPIENRFQAEIYPFIANTHTDTNTTGQALTHAYHQAQQLIKRHVGANDQDAIITCGSGMTAAINKFQRILGLKVHEKFTDRLNLDESEKPHVFVTHMEHHSNQTSWLETICDVEIIPPGADGLPDLSALEASIKRVPDNKLKIAAITGASNVTGIETPYHAIAKIMHAHGGLCFVDFACGAPYMHINMHPSDPQEKLDAIYFSPHKFLGGPGSSGVLIFDKALYKNQVPDHPGGGTVLWTNPWKKHAYFDDIETREDGGTPGFLQTIRTAFAIQLKEAMGVDKIRAREEEIAEIIWNRLDSIPNLHILASNQRHRLGIYSFYIDGLHYNVCVKMLNDKFGVQTRGGCSCAGTYGHYLLNVDEQYSNTLTSEISKGNCSNKPGWVRMSIHPTMTNEEVQFVCDAIVDIAKNHTTYQNEYAVDYAHGTISHKQDNHETDKMVDSWFNGFAPEHEYING